MEQRTARPHRPHRLGDRPRHLAARRRLGRRHARTTRTAVLEASVDAGVTFFDTADVYGDGRSEQLIGALPARSTRTHGITVATKMGRRAEQLPENYVLDELPRVDRPLARATSASTRSTWCSCTARRRAVDRRPTRSTTRSTPSSPRARSRRYGVSVETVRPGARRDRPAARRDRADHPQRVPAQAARRGAARRARRPASASSPGCRWPPAC